MVYLARLLDQELADLLTELPAIAIDGAKGVGKTRTAQRLASTVFPLASRDVAANVAGGPAMMR
ncbi:MAG: hypothetical protein LBK72_11285, partial [Bifidobacteriaceae bacterium]|nr:hypothetical protein [Bifidobacteriaceae bacterium]